MNIKVTARRLRVFRFVKEHMELHGECPTAGMVAEALDLSKNTALLDMRRLHGAAGLPLPINSYEQGMKVAASHYRMSHHSPGRGVLTQARNGGEISHAAPVDLVMRENRKIPAWAAGGDE